VLGEDVEDQCLAIHDVAFEALLKVSLLCRCERIVEDHDVDVECLGHSGQFVRLARADVPRGVRRVASDQLHSDGLGTCGVGEECELVERSFGFFGAVAGELDTDEVRLLYGDVEIGDRCGQPPAGSALMVVCHEPNAIRLLSLCAPDFRRVGSY
jgi:hypothetical protein